MLFLTSLDYKNHYIEFVIRDTNFEFTNILVEKKNIFCKIDTFSVSLKIFNG